MLDQRPLTGLNQAKFSSAAKVANDYLTLTKPPIILLLLITALGGMFLATQGVPSLRIAILVCLGGALGAGGANALNHYFDRDIDQIMSRTRQRPVPSQRISRRHALGFGILLNLLAFLILAAGVNLLAAALTLAATLFYILVYTKWLKRTTPHNIVIGGAAGAIPPLVGWAGVTGGSSAPRATGSPSWHAVSARTNANKPTAGNCTFHDLITQPPGTQSNVHIRSSCSGAGANGLTTHSSHPPGFL